MQEYKDKKYQQWNKDLSFSSVCKSEQSSDLFSLILLLLTWLGRMKQIKVTL